MTQSPVTRRSGLTLVEILIAMIMTLIVLFAMMEAFKYASGEMQRSRAVIEMSNQLRAAQELLRSDLEHMTLDPRPWTQTALPKGYFEYIEAVGRDSTNAVSATENYLGDVDDILAFTVNRPEQPFRGRYNGNIIESPMAEVIWWTHWDDRNSDNVIDFDESVTLYRRVLLIRPDLNLSAHTADATFFSTNDVSARVDSSNSLVANRLEDLGHRGARVARNSNSSFPHLLNRNLLDSYKMAANSRPTGDDVVLNNLAGFDVKVYSPTTAIQEDNNLVLQPGDVGYASASNKAGAFVDLHHNCTGWFGAAAHVKSGLSGNTVTAYDTWTPVYEVDGVAQNGTTDQATNGLDDDGANGVDDTNERDTMPPYPYAVRGLKVSLRLVEKNTKQVRQASVIHSFVPE